jgi:hypothetical protein
LCGTEIVSYGVLFYAFPVLAGGITAGTGWSRTAIAAKVWPPASMATKEGRRQWSR